MSEPDARLLVGFTLSEVLLFGVLAWQVAAGLFGAGTFLAGVARPLRMAALVVLLGEMAVPLFVLVDSRRRDIDGVWVHVAAMPLVNLVGLVAYLLERERLDG